MIVSVAFLESLFNAFLLYTSLLHVRLPVDLFVFLTFQMVCFLKCEAQYVTIMMRFIWRRPFMILWSHSETQRPLLYLVLGRCLNCGHGILTYDLL